MLRRIRGVLGTALTWGAAWALVGLAYGGMRWFPRRHDTIYAAVHVSAATPLVIPMVKLFAAMGVAAGALFAVGLIRAERRAGTIEGIPIRRAAVWGAVAGLALDLGFVGTLLTSSHIHERGFFPGFFLALLGINTVIVTALGAASAAGSLALARRAPKEPEQFGPPVPGVALPG